MGFDVTYHPVTVAEMKYWCLDRLPEIASKDISKAYSLAKEAGFDESDTNNYIGLLSQLATFPIDDDFSVGIGFGLTAVQGMFRTYYYTRNCSLTGFMEQCSQVQGLMCSLEKDIGFTDKNSVSKLTQNYCAGVWLDPDAVNELLNLLSQDEEIREEFEKWYRGGQAEIVLDALKASSELNLGLLEASDVITPNPLDLNSSTACTKLLNCDPRGALLYRDVALKQLKDAGLI